MYCFRLSGGKSLLKTQATRSASSPHLPVMNEIFLSLTFTENNNTIIREKLVEDTNLLCETLGLTSCVMLFQYIFSNPHAMP